MPKKNIIISILLINNFMITNLLSCEKYGTRDLIHTAETRLAVPVPAEAPSILSLIARITDLTLALSAEMHKRALFERSIAEQLADQRRKGAAEIRSLEARILALERR